MMVEKIISGGHTGVDRVALDVALKLGITRGGWIPKGRMVEDGPIGYAKTEGHGKGEIRSQTNEPIIQR